MNSLLFRLIDKEYPLETSGNGTYYKPASGDPSSLVYDSNKDIFHWNRLDIHGDALTWLMRVKGETYSKAKNLVSASKEKLRQHILTKKNPIVGGIKTSPHLVKQFFNYGLDNRDYWYKRHLTDSIINRFQLGYYEEWYTIPLYLDGEFANFQTRREEPKKIISYWYEQNTSYLFNTGVISHTKEIYIVESPVDCLLMIQEGFPVICHTGGAVGWQSRWNKLFNNVDNIYIIYDNDHAGARGARKVARNLGLERTKIYTFWEEEKKGYDIVDFVGDGGDLSILRDFSLRDYEINWGKKYGI